MSQKPRILVLDDDEIIRILLEKHLTRAGFDVTTEENPDKALADALANRFDLIVTDFIMDPMTGFDLAKCLRDEGKDIPIIMITASLHPGVTRAAKKLGIQAIVSKPFQGEEVVHLVRKLLMEFKGDPTVQP